MSNMLDCGCNAYYTKLIKEADLEYRIKEIREAQGLSQVELSEKSGVSRAIISGLESGTITTTTTKTLIRIAEALGKKVSDIFFN